MDCSSIQAVNKLVQTIQDSPHKYAAALFINIKQVFDNVWWPAVVNRLDSLNLPLPLLTTLRNYLHTKQAHLSSTNCMTSKLATKGCPQRSVLGPTLWNLCMDSFLETHPHEDCTKLTTPLKSP